MKPYAWINVNDEYKILFDDKLPTYYPQAWIPLYTHPAKTLTDDEIRILINEVPDYNIDIHDLMEFARAILKKASEK